MVIASTDKGARVTSQETRTLIVDQRRLHSSKNAYSSLTVSKHERCAIHLGHSLMENKRYC